MNKGYIALISILIISALVLILAVSMGLSGISESGMSLQSSLASESFYVAAACAEETLNRLKIDLNYSGNESITINGSSCFVELIEGSGNQDRVVKVLSNIVNQVTKLRIDIAQINPVMQINSWTQVADF